ncbi:MAG: DUF4340 domain-containing protein [Deltaproteobacteria bacterium]|nr:DUF4340 domain-containing protein [Deltaproteobacteria bacterium]
MKLRSLVVYFAVLIVLGLFYYFYEVQLIEKENKLKEAQTKIFELNFDQVTEIKCRVGGTEMRIIKEGADQWRLTSPVNTPADRWAVEGLIRGAVEGKKDRVFTEPVNNLAEFGLDQPGIAVSLMAEKKYLAPTLFIGNENPMGQLYYAKLTDNNQVFTVTSGLRNDLNKTLFDLRDKSMVLAPADKIDGLRIAGREEVEVSKKGIRRWDMVKPGPGPADEDEMQKIIYRALKGRVKEFVTTPADEKEYGFEQPKAKIQVLSAGKISTELTIGRAKEKVSADDQTKKEIEGYWTKSSERPEIMLVGDDLVALLDKTAEDIRDRHILTLDTRDLKTLTITRGESKFKAQKVKVKDTDLWEVVEPANSKSQDRNVESFLLSMSNLKYARVLDAQPENIEKYGMKSPDLVIDFSGNEGPSTRFFVNLKPTDEKYVAVRVADGPVMLVEQSSIINHLPEEIRPAPESDSSKK